MTDTGIVIKSTGSWFIVKYGDKTIECKIRGKFRLKGIKTTCPIAVGDVVDFEITNNTGFITQIHPRKNYIIRKSINLSKEAHILAANIDQTVILATLVLPETPMEFIDRVLVTSEIYKIPAIIVFNKIDLYSPDLISYLHEIMAMYEKIGYRCFETSVYQSKNIDRIYELFKNKTSLIAGNSGVGKSSLINKLDSNLNLKTGEISEYHLSGKHTTTFAEMYQLSFGGYIIDTPGIKGFGVVDMKTDDIAHNFPEMFSLLSKCKFNNCTHIHEPGCAVKSAYESGEISASRYRSYISLIQGDDSKYRDDSYR